MVSQTSSRKPLPSSRARRRAEKIIGLISRFCTEQLDDEYGALCAKLVSRLAPKRPSPLESGQVRVWAGAVVYVIGYVNLLFDPTQLPHLRFAELSRLTSVSKSALVTRGRLIMCLLRIMPLEPEYCRRERLAQNPFAWMVTVNGLLVDARTLPLEVQAELARRGLIPDTMAAPHE